MPDHDDLYHRLYAHPKLVADMMREFVHEPWVADLDFDRMKRFNAKFHVRGISKREGDLIWQIPTRSKTPLYLITLLEFQSRSYRWMVVRVLAYVCLLWLQLVHEKRIRRMGFLPPVFPVIIHNGDRPWMAPIRLRELIGLPEDSYLWKFQPDGQCFLLDEVRYRPEDLDERDSLSSLLVRIGHCVTPDELPELARKVIAWMKKHPEFEELRQAISDLFLYTLTALGVKSQTHPMANINLEEVPTMLQTRIEHWKKERKKEWHQEGLREGEQKGLREGGVRTLLRQMVHKFGTVPDWAKAKLANADQETLGKWTDKILDADSLDAVFQ